jgi:3-phenylpropionate/cinnamic acid dioxygenase small subunit
MPSTVATMERTLPFDHPMHLAAHRFMVEEAYAQDRRDFDAWLEMLAPDVSYRVPVTSTFGANPHKQGEMDHLSEDLYSLRMRVARLKTNLAWTESPPSRTRHLITNVCCYRTEKSDEIRVLSAFLVFRTQGDYQGPDLLAGMRDDILRQCGEDLRLVRRVVSLDESVLKTQNLAIFL